MALAIGLNSGSSLDSIDAVLLEVGLDADSVPKPPKVVGYIEYFWPREVKEQILKAMNFESGIPELMRLNFVAGAAYAEAVQVLLREVSVAARDVEVVGVDGQTIYQEPPESYRWQGDETDNLLAAFQDHRLGSTLQIGEGAVIAASSGIPTVTQFRPADMARGGTGAPLMQFFDWVFFRDRAPLVTLNIGGIANIQAVDPDRSRMMAFDTGPGNILLDRMAMKYLGTEYDKSGAMAKQGHVDDELLQELLHEHPFFKRRPPRSAWREDFSQGFMEGVITSHPDLSPANVMATFNALTVEGILLALAQVPYLDQVPVLVASGGGAFNEPLMARLRERLPAHMRLTTSEEFGIPVKGKEAAKFGTLGFATMHKFPNNIPACSGARGFAILGKVHWPPPAA